MKILVVAPHPDDEAIGMAGTILRHVESGDHVQTVFLTSGEKGIPDLADRPLDVIEAREDEARAASLMLGTLPPIFWRLPDGGVEVAQSTVLKLRALCAQVDRVYVPNLDEDHVDHRAAAQLVQQAVAALTPAPRVLMFEVWTPLRRPDVFVDISDRIGDKISAIACHLSQVRLVRFDLAALSLNHYRGQLHAHGGEYAEAFTRMKGTGAMSTGIVFLTYTPSMEHPRVSYARSCLADLLKNIRPADDIHLHIADDGSPQEHRDALVELANAYGFGDVTVTNSERGGYGHSYNLATQVVHSRCDYVLPVEDDWRLLKPLDVSPLIQAIEESQGLLRCIRLGYLGYSSVLRGQLVSFADQSFLLFDHASDETYIWAGHPRLETVAFQRDLGGWPVGIGAGATETVVVRRPAARVGVAWPLDAGINASQQWASMFAHVGDEHIGDAALQEGGAE